MAVDYTLLTFLLTVGTLIATLLFRKRLFRAFLMGLFKSIPHVDFAGEVLGTWETKDTGEGTQTRVWVPSVQLRGIVETLAPLFLASALKSIKLKVPPGPSPLAGVDLSDLSAALPSIIGMLPKRYQPYAAMAVPFLQKLAPGLLQGKGSVQSGKGSAVNPFLKELQS